MAESTATPETTTPPVVVDPEKAVERGRKLFNDVQAKFAHDITEGHDADLSVYGSIPINGLMAMGASQEEALAQEQQTFETRQRTIVTMGRGFDDTFDTKHLVDFFGAQELIRVRLFGTVAAIQFGQQENGGAK